MQKTDAQLTTQKDQIKTETVANANSATRIGQMFEDGIDSKINNDKIDTDPSLNTAGKTLAERDALKTYIANVIGGIDALTDEDIDTLAEINAILTDADLVSQTTFTTALDTKRNIGTRAAVTLANGVTTIDWAAGSIQVLTISETKVITAISNPVVDEVITLILDGTFSLTFSGLTADIEGSYNAGEENRIYIHCLKVSGGAEYRITYDNSLGGAGDGVEAYAALTDGATVNWAVTKAVSNKTLTIAGNRTFVAPTGMSSGWMGNAIITASGADRTISIPAGATHKLKGVGDDTIKTITIPSGLTIILSWTYDGTNFYWWFID
jgi:hypothetical protein